MLLPREPQESEPRWPALLAILTSGLLYMALPGYLAIGPRWLLIVLICVLEVPSLVLHHRGFHRSHRVLGYLVAACMTGFMLWSLSLLVMNLPEHKQSAVDMLHSAAALWASNILVFALWYWRLDGGGPSERDRRTGHTQGAFLFPQMTWDQTRGKWSPRFLDYLFLAFTTSTALSPTDVPVLSRWAKVLVMSQACISLTIIALLGARAVNIM